MFTIRLIARSLRLAVRLWVEKAGNEALRVAIYLRLNGDERRVEIVEDSGQRAYCSR